MKRSELYKLRELIEKAAISLADGDALDALDQLLFFGEGIHESAFLLAVIGVRSVLAAEVLVEDVGREGGGGIEGQGVEVHAGDDFQHDGVEDGFTGGDAPCEGTVVAD